MSLSIDHHFQIKFALLMLACPMLAIEPLELRAEILIVDNSDPVACAVPDDNLYCQIQDAVDDAAAGDTIKVNSGIYERVVINTDNVRIQRATAKSDPVIVAPGNNSGVRINASGVTIQGLEVRNGSPGFDIKGDKNRLRRNNAIDNITSGFNVSGDDNRLYHNTAAGNQIVGFFIVLSKGNRLVGNLAIGNLRGIQINRSNETTLVDNFVLDNDLRIGESGLCISFSDGNSLIGNTVSGGAGQGFNLIYCNDNKLVNNAAWDNNGNGFLFNFCDNNSLVSNVAEENVSNGIAFSLCNDNTLTGNTVNGNTRDGFFISFGSTGNRFVGNRARDNGIYGFELRGEVSDNYFKGNSCSGNATGGANLPGVCRQPD